MKIASQNNVADIMSVSGNTPAQSQDASLTQDFQSYIKQSASTKNYQSSQVNNSAGDQKTKSDSVSQSSNYRTADEQTESAVADEQASSSAGTQETRTDSSPKAETEDNPAEDFQKDGTEAMEALQDPLVAVISAEQLAGLLNNIQLQLQELLGIDEGEMEQLLLQSDIQPIDLLNENVQQQFLLASQEAQPVDLLTNEELSDLLRQMNSLIEDVVSVPEISASTLQSAIEQIHSIADEEVGDVVQNQTDVELENALESPENSGIQFTVDAVQTEDRDSQGDAQGQSDMESMKEQVLSQLNQSLGQVTEASATEEEITPAEIVNQVVEEIKLVARQDTTSMELQLYPEHLGKVAIQVSAKNGLVTAQITAENEMARAALEGSIQTLKETLQNQQLKVEAIEVMVATSSFSQEQYENQQTGEDAGAAGKGTRRIHLEDLEDETDLTEEEQLNADIMRQEGRSVDYTA